MCDRCEELQEQVAYLQSELGLRLEADDLHRLRLKLGLTASEARVALAMLRANGRPVTRVQLEEIMPSRHGLEDRSYNLVSAVIAHMRTKLGRTAIVTAWGAGYQLSAAGREAVGAALMQEAA